jgi:DNA-binding YbaB/EbfC family protein
MNQQQQMMAQVKKMQAEMVKAQDELASTVVAGTAAGGAVTIEMTCDNRVTAVKLSKEAVDPEDIETLEDLLVVAINDAVGKAKEAAEKRMSSVTGGLRIPGLM